MRTPNGWLAPRAAMADDARCPEPGDGNRIGFTHRVGENTCSIPFKPCLLLAVLIYGTIQWSRRKRGPTQAVREDSTRRLYQEGAKAEKREAKGAPEL